MTEEKKLALKAHLLDYARKKFPGDTKRQHDYMWRVYTSLKERREQQ